VYRVYWELAANRQRIFFRRFNGEQPPWSSDPILNEYKFCSTYRASDRVSQFLIQHVIYDGVSRGPEETAFRILLFKIFNRIETWQYLDAQFEGIRYRRFDYARCADLLERYQRKGNPIYSNAYMSCATKAYGFDQKHRNHLALIRAMNHDDAIGAKVCTAKSLQDVFLLLRAYPLIGNFMAYQLAIDLNYSEITNFSEDDFTIAGPGAERGIKKCFMDLRGHTLSDAILWMTDNQEGELDRLGIEFPTLWGRRLHAIDCQGLFCETDKYSRVRFPELKSNRTRIKARFLPASDPIDYFYPPKWGINHRLGRTRSRCAVKSLDYRRNER